MAKKKQSKSTEKKPTYDELAAKVASLEEQAHKTFYLRHLIIDLEAWLSETIRQVVKDELADITSYTKEY